MARFRKLYPCDGIYVTTAVDPDSSQLYWNTMVPEQNVTLYIGGFGLLAFSVWILGDQILLSWTQMNIKLRVCGVIYRLFLFLVLTSSSWAPTAAQSAG